MATYDEKALAQARRRALWELGDADWANVILSAYLHPEVDAEDLDAEMSN